MKEFRNRVAVVTGAASGIGRAMALDFARRGMRLVLADIEAEPLEAVKEEAEALGAECLAQPVDVSQRDSVQALADAAFDRFGAVHVLCNNAGVTVGGVRMVDATPRDWEWVLGVNLWGTIHGVQAFLPRMIEQQQEGHIVNTGSILSMAVLWPRTAVYTTSKFAVMGLSEALALELEGTDIGISVICPSSVDTRIYEAERNRPADLQVERRPVNLRERMRAISDDWITPEQVSERVMRAIEQDAFYVFTHKDSAEQMEARFERIRKDYPPSE